MGCPGSYIPRCSMSIGDFVGNLGGIEGPLFSGQTQSTFFCGDVTQITISSGIITGGKVETFPTSQHGIEIPPGCSFGMVHCKYILGQVEVPILFDGLETELFELKVQLPSEIEELMS